MGDDIQFPINYNQAVIDDMCKHQSSRTRIKEFGRSFIQNAAMLFGMGHASSYMFGKGDLDQKIENMSKDMEQKKWEITQQLFEKQMKSEENMIEVFNEILLLIGQQSSYYESIFDPQIQTINLLDQFRIILLLSIIYVLIAFIDWK